MAGRKRTFTVGQLAMSVGFFAVAFSLIRLVGTRIQSVSDLLMLVGYCVALGAAIGILQNRPVKGSSLGLAGFFVGFLLMILFSL